MPLVENWKGVTVSYKEKWSDSWVTAPNLIAVSLKRGLGNGVDQALLMYREGNLFNPGDIAEKGTSLFQVQQSPIAEKFYIRLQRSETPKLDWIGYVINSGWPLSGLQETATLQKYLAASDKQYTAVGMEWFLDRRQITTSIHYTDIETSRPIGFNMGLGDTRGVVNEERGNMDDRPINVDGKDFYQFAVNKEWAVEWTADKIVDHLLKYQGPRDAGDAGNGVNPSPAPMRFTFDTALLGSYLRWYKPDPRTDARTLFQLFNEMISPNRGLVWWLGYDENANEMRLEVNSTTPTAITMPGGGQLPAARKQVALDAYSLQQIDDSSTFQFDAERQYDRIRVRGAHRTSTFTVSVKDGSLETFWANTYEQQYIAGNAESEATAADRYRQQERFKGIYQEFRIPALWNGRSGDGSGTGQTEYSCPVIQNTGSITGSETIIVNGMRLLRTLFIKEGYDYADAESPTANSRDSKEKPDWLPAFGVVKHGDKWMFLDRSAGHRDEGDVDSERLKTSYNLKLLEGAPGLRIEAATALPHSIAKNHFDIGSPAPSDTQVEIDYEDCRFTVAAEWDAHCEAVYPETISLREGDPLQELVIDIGDRARWDYLAEHTVYDIDGNALKKVTSGGSVRDDRQLCEEVATAAWSWYITPRGSFSIQFNDFRVPTYQAIGEDEEEILPGSFVTILGDENTDSTESESIDHTSESILLSAAFLQGAITVNAIVTQIEYRFEEGTVAIQGGYAELDFGGVI